MEQNPQNNSISSNGISLHLRSKEVSEVMGNIPAWIGSWGVFLIGFLFIASILFISNIHLTEKIQGKASISSTHVEPAAQVQQNFFLKVAIPANEYRKIKTRGYLTVSFEERENSSYKLNIIKFPADKIKLNNDSCIVQFALSPVVVNKMRRDIPALNSISNINCELLANISIFQKVCDWFVVL